ncbi:hypothetical protein M8J75_006257 [Diaphorina citri]|nr:hypothetical protein M8J75_006257 [Diaphorina citri]
MLQSPVIFGVSLRHSLSEIPKVVRTAALIVIASGCCSYCVFWIFKRRSDRYKRPSASYRKIPTVWKQVGYVTEINIYPLKSGYYLSAEKAFCDFKGLSQIGQGYPLSDRCFLLFNRSKGTYISNIAHNRLVLVKVTALDKDLIQFSVHNDDTYTPFVLNMADFNRSGSVHTIRMYEKDLVHAFDCGDEASEWFSRFLLGKEDPDIRLGYDCDEQRKLNGTIYERYRHHYGDHITNEDMGKYAYLASYMLMNEASVKDLNERLQLKGETEVSIHNFRGNIILSTDQAYEEDNWDWVRLNEDIILRGMKPCTRCTVTCLDPETGQKNLRTEPLKTLRSYRGPIGEKACALEKGSPRLGLYCGLYSRGTVQKGDPVYVAVSEKLNTKVYE